MKAPGIILRVSEQGYIPHDEAARKQHAKIPPGTLVGARVSRSRSVQQNSLYWAVLQKVVDGTGRWPTTHALHNALKMECGLVDIVQQINGKKFHAPSSTRFSALNQDEFQTYFDAALHVICDQVLGGMEIEELLEMSRDQDVAA